ncbi:MAG: alpha/beta fold hydrolase [Actinomycetota bacterium]
MDPTGRLTLPDGRSLAYDDVGDPTGTPVVYLHGTPDCRLSRHPDDDLARRVGVRLVAVDRPGAGGSSPHPGGGLVDLGRDLEALLDHLGIDRSALLGWSSGGLCALAAATVLGPRAPSVALVGTVPPIEAYEDPLVVGALSPERQHFVELAREVPPAELGAELAPYLVPEGLDAELALAHVLEGTGERGRAELAAVPGAAEQLARALPGAVAHGVEPLAQDVARQLEPGLDLAAVGGEVRTTHGTEDGISPPAVGRWLVEHLTTASVEVEVIDGAHHLLFPHWARLLEAAARPLGR